MKRRIQNGKERRHRKERRGKRRLRRSVFGKRRKRRKGKRTG